MNNVSLIGRFVRPIEVKTVSDDRLVINNVVAVSRHKKSEGGQNADFIPVTIWGHSAKIVQQYCDKGNLIGLSGRLMSRQYDASDGSHHFVVEFVADHVYLLEGKRYHSEDVLDTIPS